VLLGLNWRPRCHGCTRQMGRVQDRLIGEMLQPHRAMPLLSTDYYVSAMRLH
jgi:hypothetical protein